MQEPEVFKSPEGGSVHGLAMGTAAVGQDAVPETIDNRLHPCFRLGMLTQQVNRGYPEVPVVDDGVVSTGPGVPLLVHVRPPAIQQHHEAVSDLTLLGIRQYLIHQVESESESVHVAVGRVEVLLHMVAVVPACRGPQPCAGTSKPAHIADESPGEGVILDQGRGLHGGVEGQVELVVGVWAVCSTWDPQPRPLTCIQLTIGQKVGEDSPANRIGWWLVLETGIVAGPE